MILILPFLFVIKKYNISAWTEHRGAPPCRVPPRHRPAELFEKLFYQVLGNVTLHAPGKKSRFGLMAHPFATIARGIIKEAP